MLAADEFCRQSRIWRETSEEITVTQDEIDYELEPENPALIVDVEKVVLNQRILNPVTPGSHASHGYSLLINESPTLRLIGHQSGRMVVDLILAPDPRTRTLPDFFWNDWRKTLASGTLAKLLLVPNQPFTSPDLATFHERQFRAGIVSATSRALSGNVKPHLRTRPCYA